MSKKENIDFAIVGEIVPGKEVEMQAGFFRGFLNFVAMTRFINSAPKAYKSLKKMNDSFSLSHPEDVTLAYKVIDKNLKVLFDAYSLHCVTSSQSGALYTAILNIHSKNKLPQPHHMELVAKLYSNITDVESADVLRYIDELAELLVSFENIKSDFLDVSDEKSILYLTKTGPESVKQSWTKFIERHGHRCVREAEMHEKEWAVDPMPVIEGLKTKTSLLVSGHKSKINGFAYKKVDINSNGLNAISKQIVKLILPKARKAVARREQTKAWSIRIQYKFKKAYQHLAELLISKGLLSDREQIYFLQHGEIGELIKTNDSAYWIKKADQRRKIYPEMQKLAFPDLCFGLPVPEIEDHIADEGGLRGIPVSQGIAKGKVRLVKSMKDAKLLKKDEIMVARFTDIGWTPFYSVLGGLITEIGSPLSHGAVVAREYGLPAIVSMKGAMSTLKNGQEIELDAVKGTVKVLYKE
jgi:pyruvate,water dikinase